MIKKEQIKLLRKRKSIKLTLREVSKTKRLRKNQIIEKVTHDYDKEKQID